MLPTHDVEKIRKTSGIVDLVDRLNVWCEKWAPNVSIKLVWDVARDVIRRPRLDRADECAARLHLSYDERTRLGITTIGAYDMDKREREKRGKSRKRARDRERAAQKRAERRCSVPRLLFNFQPIPDPAMESRRDFPSYLGAPPTSGPSASHTT